MNYEKFRHRPSRERDGPGPLPGAYNVAGRAPGEIPAWIQRPRPNPVQGSATSNQESFIVDEAEAVAVASVHDETIIAASVVMERRIRFHRMRNLGRRPQQSQAPRTAQATTNQHEVCPQQEESCTPSVEATDSKQWTRSMQQQPVANDARGNRVSKQNLLEDNPDDDVLQDRFLQGLQSVRVPHDEEIKTDHPHVQSVLEVFPDADVERVKSLLREESLATTLIVLSEESLDEPADEMLPSPNLTSSTTYAQATEQDRSLILSYIKEIFPDVSTQHIESVLMKHSTHEGVGILASCTEEDRRKPPPVASKRQSLIDDSENEEEEMQLLDRWKIPWQPPQNSHSAPRLEMKRSASVDTFKQPAAAPSEGATAKEQPMMRSQRSVSYDDILELVLTESKRIALEEQRKSWGKGRFADYVNEQEGDQGAKYSRISLQDFYASDALQHPMNP